MSCFLTPTRDERVHLPAELKDEIDGWLEGRVPRRRPELPVGRQGPHPRRHLPDGRPALHVCERLLEREQLRLLHDGGHGRRPHPPRVLEVHGPDAPEARAGQPLRERHPRLLRAHRRPSRPPVELVGDDTTVLVVSDHGRKAMLGGVCINEWLIEHGWLGPRGDARTRRHRLERCQVDWSRTKAWGGGGYYGRLFLNVARPRAAGIIAPEDYEAERDRLIAELSTLTDHGARRSQVDAYRPEDSTEVTQRGARPDRLLRRSRLALGRQRRLRRQSGPSRTTPAPTTPTTPSTASSSIATAGTSGAVATWARSTSTTSHRRSTRRLD